MDDLDQGSGVARAVDESGAGLALCRPESPTVQSLATVPTGRYMCPSSWRDRPKRLRQHRLEAPSGIIPLKEVRRSGAP